VQTLEHLDTDPEPNPVIDIQPVIPTLTNAVNLSLTFAQFHPILKESVISRLKKPSLDKDQLSK